MKFSVITTDLSRMPPHIMLSFLRLWKRYLQCNKPNIFCHGTARSVLANISPQSPTINKEFYKHVSYIPQTFNFSKSWYAHLS